MAVQNPMSGLSTSSGFNQNGSSASSGMPSLLATSTSASATPARAKKQVQAQQTRIVALSKHLMTRLQYATFKVEHGWTRQSLPEVENLYYRQNKGGLGNNMTRSNSSTSPSNNKAPMTPSLSNIHSMTSRLFKDAALKKPELEGGDVFGGYGLATPPASGGTHPSSFTANLAGARGRSNSSTPISPPASSNSKLGEPFSLRKSPSRNFMSSSNNSRTGSISQPRSTASSINTSNGVTSYADFWNRVGNSSVTGGALGISPRYSSTAQLDSAGTASPFKSSAMFGSKRPAESLDRATLGSPTFPLDRGETSSLGGGFGIGSPLKRVRMDLSSERGAQSSLQLSSSSSPVKSNLGGLPLVERGPSFSASPRKPQQSPSSERAAIRLEPASDASHPTL